MVRWADYLISAVRYDKDGQIVELERHQDTEDRIGKAELVDKASVVSDITAGVKYMTIYSTLSNWKLGDKIRSSRVDGYFYIRTDDNKVKHDNLGSLPELASDNSSNLTDRVERKKTKDVTGSQISPQDKAMLKNMGARGQDSIISVETESVQVAESKMQESSKPRDHFAEYEKDYLERISKEPEQSPHGTLPKGFTKSEIQKTVSKVKSEPEQSPHGTLPKGFAKDSIQETVSSEKKSESPHGTLPKGFTKSDVREEIIPEKAKLEPKQTHGTLPKGFTKSDMQTKTAPKPSPHGTLPKEKPPAKKTAKTAEIRKAQSQKLIKIERQIDDLEKSIDKLEPKSADILAYCVRCKAKRKVKDPIQSELKNGRPAIKGTCTVCGAKMSRMGILKPS